MVHAVRQQSILVIRRAEREGDSWSGHWSFPGGWRDPADRDPLDTAIREMEEECGVRLAPEQMEQALPHTLAGRRVGRYVLVAPFVFRTEEEFATVLNPREAVEARWVPLSLMRDPSRHAMRPVPGRGDAILFPSVDLSGTPLWGFTYRQITTWLGLVPGHQPKEVVGLEAAGTVLEFLLSRGLTLASGWADRPDGTKWASVTGAIPVAAVLAHFSAQGLAFPTMNCLEVCTYYVRVAGLAWEEYFITVRRDLG
jgi:8-oxo-dGTP pyrophosphatase MutT (NUDIX family)